MYDPTACYLFNIKLLYAIRTVISPEKQLTCIHSRLYEVFLQQQHDIRTINPVELMSLCGVLPAEYNV